MQLLSTIPISRAGVPAVIQLLQGDLSCIPAAHATDILVMAAFPGDYTALPGSLIAALENRGLRVASLAADKAIDLRTQLHCWLSQPLSAAQQEQFHFKKILCFEPGDTIKTPETVVGDIFRCINTFAFDEDHNEIAMPIIGTGYQRVPMERMLPALLKACHFWLQQGLPLKSIQLVVHGEDKASQALALFNDFRSGLILPAVAPAPPPAAGIPAPRGAGSLWERLTKGWKRPVTKSRLPPVQPAAPSPARYNYFLSYAHAHARDIALFVDALQKQDQQLSVFYDKDSIAPGGLWIQQISEAIQRADKVLVFLSPDYDQSPVCWDEFQCAKLQEYNLKKNIIQTVYLYGHRQSPLPLIMGIYSYIDCREGDRQKLLQCVQQLLAGK